MCSGYGPISPADPRRPGNMTYLWPRSRDFAHCTAVGTVVNSFLTSFTPLVCCATCCALDEASAEATVPLRVTTPATVSTWISLPVVILFSCKPVLTFAVIAESDTAVAVP